VGGGDDVGKIIDGKKHYNQSRGRRRGVEERYGGCKGERTRAAVRGEGAAITIAARQGGAEEDED
jgi:hypothetical protein